MHEPGSIRLFRQGPAAELRLFFLALLAVLMLVVDARWQALEPAREVLSVAIYPFQRAILAPRDAYEHVISWKEAAAEARSEKEALQRQRIELAQLSTHSVQFDTENDKLMILSKVTTKKTQ